MVRLESVSHITVYKDVEHYCGPGALDVERLGNGDLGVVFREGKAHWDATGRILMVRSSDGGETWDPSRKVVVCDTPYDDQSALIARLSDATLIVNTFEWAFFNERGMPTARTELEGSYVVMSKDDGYTWGSPIKINPAPLRWVMPYDSVKELPDGTLLNPGAGMMWARRNHSLVEEKIRSALYRSRDGGNNWDYLSTIAWDPSGIMDYDEPTLLRLPNGRMVAVLRTNLYYRDGGFESNPTFLYQCVSEDNGLSWSYPKNTGLIGQPADSLLLKDRRVLLTYGYRWAPYGIRASVSEDGLTWDVSKELILRDDGLGVDIGYPHSVQLDDGRILTVYYYYGKDEVRYIAGTLYELEG